VRHAARQLLVLTIALVAVCGALALITWIDKDYRSCPFLQPGNLEQLLRQSATLIVLSTGMTFVIIAGGIDLSVGSVMALGTVLIALPLTHGATLPVALACGVAGAAACGLATGLVTVRGGVPSFIATLAMFLIARSVAFVVSDGQTLYAESKLAIVPLLPLVLPIVVIAAGWFLLAKTAFGRGVYAVGGNEEAARLSGLPVGGIRMTTFLIAAVCSGLAACIHWARTGTGSNLTGEGAELDAIAAVVIGGTSISGGEGQMLGTLVGALMMIVLRNGLVLLGVKDEYQKIVIGVVVVAAVLADRLRARRAPAA
jgi:ribose transport system permease protein